MGQLWPPQLATPVSFRDEPRRGGKSFMSEGRKTTHGVTRLFLSHGLDKSQRLSRGRANVINPAFLETTNGRALVRVHEPPPASDIRHRLLFRRLALFAVFVADKESVLYL